MTLPSPTDPEPPYLAGLNPPQRDAVLTTEGPVLVLAGAGTGKTAALTARLAHLVYTRRAWPSELLAVTFTNKAAREMRERVGRLIGQAVEGMPWLGTFHSIGARMLRRHAELVGLQSNFTILDTDDQLRLLKQLIAAADVDEKRWPARLLAGLIDRWKNKGWTPDQVDAGEAEGYANGKGAKLYAAYQARLRDLNACDFGDLLLHMLVILKGHRDVLEHYQQRFKYILVDEYQDTNQSQYLWLRLLAQERKNICCVGDDDQSIYSWRGAEVSNILRFEKDFPGAKIIRLEQNYRSTPNILAAASGLIAQNSGRLGKELWTELDEGDKVQVIGVWDGPEEARRVGDELNDPAPRRPWSPASPRQLRHPRPRPVPDPRVRRPVHRHRPALSHRRWFPLLRAREIRDALAYLRVINQPADDLAFERIVNVLKRDLGDKAVAQLTPSHAEGIPLSLAAARILDTDELTGAARRRTSPIWSAISPAGARSLRRTLPSRTGPPRPRRERLHGDAPGRPFRRKRRAPRNLIELTRAMEDYETLGAFLEHVSLVMD